MSDANSRKNGVNVRVNVRLRQILLILRSRIPALVYHRTSYPRYLTLSSPQKMSEKDRALDCISFRKLCMSMTGVSEFGVRSEKGQFF